MNKAVSSTNLSCVTSANLLDILQCKSTLRKRRAPDLQQRCIVTHDVSKDAIQSGTAGSSAAAQDGAIRQHQAAQQRKVMLARVIAHVERTPTDLPGSKGWLELAGAALIEFTTKTMPYI